MAIFQSTPHIYTEEDELRQQQFGYFNEAVEKYIEPLKKIYQKNKGQAEAHRQLEAKWKGFITQLKSHKIVINKDFINNLLNALEPQKVVWGQEVNASIANPELYKLMLNRLFLDSYTKEGMNEIFYSDDFFPVHALVFLEAYLSEDEIRQFLKDKDFSDKKITTDWVMGFVGLNAKKNNYGMLDFLINEKIVVSNDFIDETKYGLRFNLIEPGRGQKILSKLDLKNPVVLENFKDFLASTCSNRGSRSEVVEAAFNIAKNLCITFPLERIVALKSRMNLNYTNYYKLYELVEEEKLETLQFLVGNGFLQGLNEKEVVEKIACRIEKKELNKKLSETREMGLVMEFIRKEKLQDKLSEFIENQKNEKERSELDTAKTKNRIKKIKI